MKPGVEEVGIFAPILGLQYPTAPIVLAPGLAIDRMDEGELEEARSWAIADQMMRLEYAIRFRTSLALEGDRDGLESSTKSYEIGEAGAEHIAAAIWALRLFKRGTFSVPFLISGPPFRSDAHNSRLWEQPQNGMAVYDHHDEEADSYVELFQAVHKVAAQNTSLPAALHRFSQAMARQDYEDRLVDLVIVAESILVPDRGGGTGLPHGSQICLRAGRRGPQSTGALRHDDDGLQGAQLDRPRTGPRRAKASESEVESPSLHRFRKPVLRADAPGTWLCRSGICRGRMAAGLGSGDSRHMSAGPEDRRGDRLMSAPCPRLRGCEPLRPTDYLSLLRRSVRMFAATYRGRQASANQCIASTIETLR